MRWLLRRKIRNGDRADTGLLGCEVPAELQQLPRRLVFEARVLNITADLILLRIDGDTPVPTSPSTFRPHAGRF